MKEENKNTNELNFYAVTEIVKLAKMFEENTGGELQCITLKNTDLKFIKKELYIHDSDISYNHSDHDSQTLAFVITDNNEKVHLMWFKLDNYRTTNFDSWKITKETIEYK